LFRSTRPSVPVTLTKQLQKKRRRPQRRLSTRKAPNSITVRPPPASPKPQPNCGPCRNSARNTVDQRSIADQRDGKGSFGCLFCFPESSRCRNPLPLPFVCLQVIVASLYHSTPKIIPRIRFHESPRRHSRRRSGHPHAFCASQGSASRCRQTHARACDRRGT